MKLCSLSEVEILNESLLIYLGDIEYFSLCRREWHCNDGEDDDSETTTMMSNNNNMRKLNLRKMFCHVCFSPLSIKCAEVFHFRHLHIAVFVCNRCAEYANQS